MGGVVRVARGGRSLRAVERMIVMNHARRMMGRFEWRDPRRCGGVLIRSFHRVLPIPHPSLLSVASAPREARSCIASVAL